MEERSSLSKSSTWANIALILGILVTTALALEVSLRAFYPQPTDYFYFKSEWIPGEKFLRWDNIEVSINSHGQRDYQRELKKRVGVYRIALLGDSIEFGSGVAIEDTYSKRLEVLLNKASGSEITFEVLTFTNGGTAPTGYLKMLRDEALRFNPDLVIVGFTLNDFERPRVEKTPKERAYDLMSDVHERMRLWSHLYFLTLERSRSLLYRYQVIDKSVRLRYDLDVLEARGTEFADAWRFTRGTLKQIRDLSEAHDARFAIVTFPYEMQLNHSLLELYRSAFGFALSNQVLKAKPQRLLREYADAEHVPLVDLFEAYKESADAGQQLFFREFGGALDFVHPNSRGHEIAAHILYDALRCGDILHEDATAALSSQNCNAS